ncbi:MAG: hypothetical protein OHK0046_46340 [Anaerolineae bacterium]
MPSKPVPTKCPACGTVRYLQPRDANRARQCRQCHLRQIAPLGYRATVRKYGEKWALRHVQSYHQSNPSSLEQLVADQLDALGIWYEREVLVTTTSRKSWLVDFVVGGVAIEVNGAYVHSHHLKRDRRKLRYLRRRYRYVLVLEETTIRHPAFPGRLRAMLDSLGIPVDLVSQDACGLWKVAV